MSRHGMNRHSLRGHSAATRRIAAATPLLAVVALAAACTSGGAKDANSTSSSPSVSASSVPADSSSATSGAGSATGLPAAGTAVITAAAVGGSRSANPAKPVLVNVAHGKLTSVKLVNPAGKLVAGALSGDSSSWQSTEPLGYARTYKLTASARDQAGRPTVKQETITTLTPDKQTMPYLQRIGGYPLGNGATYGVAIVPIVHFDESISDKAAAQKALTVSTSPHVAGSWFWADDQNAHWRPRSYWPAGTKVTVSAKVYGVGVGNGLYGQSDASASFQIGRTQLTVANDTAPHAVNKVRVYNAAGQVIRTMNTSMGEHSGVNVNGSYINFYTLDGTYTVLGHEQPAKMCSASYGLPANAPGGYPCENIYNATKISSDGIYLHELDTTTYAQDNGQDVSHGCLNLNQSNSKWFFDHSMVGDPVVIHGAKGAPGLKIWQGGDWSVPWGTWVAGGAQ
ncbi:MAG: Ig-like domain-containing protein [Actinomycetota bacterium]|nr:Ig-like domain-containing protein [Actinomycetota bacterium]